MTTACNILYCSLALGAGLVILALCATVALFVSSAFWERLQEVKVFISAFIGAGRR